MSSIKGRSYIDLLDDGNIYIEAGNASVPITQLGKNKKGHYAPYSIKEQGMRILYTYRLLKDYIPANFKSLNKFIYALEQQSPDNEYIQNYINLASEQLFDFIDSNGLIDNNTYFLKVDNSSNITNLYFDFLTEQVPNQKVDGAIMVNDDFTVEDLEVVDNTPEEIRIYLEDLLYQANREDRMYTFEDLQLEQKYMKYVNGFVTIDIEKMEQVPKSSVVILVSNFYSSTSLILEAHRKLNDLGVQVLFGTVLAKKN